MERNKYRVLDKKIRKIESKLIPILSSPFNPETTPSQQPIVQTSHHNLHIMNNLLSAEMASSTEPQHLAHFLKRVICLQRAVHSWTEGRPLTTQVESSGSELGSFIESCVTDDDDVGCDYTEEVSGLAGFTVYENPLFDGIVDSDDAYDDDADNDDDSDNDDADNGNDNGVGIIDEYEVEETEGGEKEALIRYIDQGEEHESDAGNKGVEKEVIKVDYQKEDGKEQEKEEEEEEEDDEDEDEDEEGGTQNCCYKILFWCLIIVMVVIFVMLILSGFPDNHAPVMLTPT